MDDLARLERLTRHLRALDAGAPVQADTDARSIRLRLTARDMTERMRADRRAKAERGRAELVVSLERIISRAPAVLPPPRPPRHTGLFNPDPPLETFWSPTPILGFRVWQMGAHLHGAKRVWYTPEYVAGCLRGNSEVMDPDVPHSDGSCGRPPCGIYAAKDPASLVADFGAEYLPMAYGVVELTGKVVEHDDGYRAQRARAIAVVVVEDEGLTRFEGADAVTRAFADPRAVLAAARPRRVAVKRWEPEVVRYLAEVRLMMEAGLGGG